jgi:hypothetical protein
LLGQNILSFLKPAPTDYLDTNTGEKIKAKQVHEYTEIEQFLYQMYNDYKQGEYAIYKDFHKKVLNDDGCPTLKKSAFRMPGYRKVLGKHVQEHVIDNTHLPIDMVIVPEEIVDSDKSVEPVDRDF